jgi:hypothetical protein
VVGGFITDGETGGERNSNACRLGHNRRRHLNSEPR